MKKNFTTNVFIGAAALLSFAGAKILFQRADPLETARAAAMYKVEQEVITPEEEVANPAARFYKEAAIEKTYLEGEFKLLKAAHPSFQFDIINSNEEKIIRTNIPAMLNSHGSADQCLSLGITMGGLADPHDFRSDDDTPVVVIESGPDTTAIFKSSQKAVTYMGKVIAALNHSSKPIPPIERPIPSTCIGGNTYG